LSLATFPHRWRQAFGGGDQALGDPLAASVLEVRIIVRGDSGFCRQRLLRGCERYEVGYVIGVARNTRLHNAVAAWEDELKVAFAETGIKQRRIHEFRYAADSWNIERRLITRLEFDAQGPNPRFVVTNLEGGADTVLDVERNTKGGAHREPRARPGVV
jgi:hypothetical protein